MRKYLDNEITCCGAILGLGYSAFMYLWLMGTAFVGYDLFAFSNVFLPFRISDGNSALYSTAFLTLSLVFFALIVRSTAHYHGEEIAKPSFMDKIPIEIYATVMAIIFVVCFVAFVDILGDNLWQYKNTVYTLIPQAEELTSFPHQTPFGVFVLLYAGIYLSRVFTFMTVLARIKCNTFLDTCLTYKICVWVWKITKNIFSRIHSFFAYWFGFASQFFKNLSYMKKLVAGSVVLYIALFILYMNMHRYNPYDYWMLFTLAFGLVFLIGTKLAIGYEKIRKSINQISNGNTNYKTDTKYMTPTMATQREELNNISTAVEAAAEKQVRSEKLRAELITNVSHDIKTPLTSIINYIDLLGREDFDNETARDYIDVLQKQSVRLKKLLEDVVEASKASTGNISANFEKISVTMAVNQAVGEYQDRADALGLTIDVSAPEEDLHIYSDGRLLWRIFDNLLSNACKYSLTGTRIYIDCHQLNNKVIITFKNISKSKLNISPDELMERFVRGDSSRNTEGSGLGLSIAQSLAGILNGQMKLSIDGDLFKATLIFDAV